MIDIWKKVEHFEGVSPHYTIMHPMVDGMTALRDFFHDEKIDEMNFILFSTSGVHGTYNTIENVEKCLNGGCDEYEDYLDEVTFLIVQPRIVALRYGNCRPTTQDDIDFLKRLRQKSWVVVQKIGAK